MFKHCPYYSRNTNFVQIDTLEANFTCIQVSFPGEIRENICELFHLSHEPSYYCFDEQADVVVGDGGAVEGGTLVDLLHHHEMEGGGNGRQGRVEIGRVLELSLCKCM